MIVKAETASRGAKERIRFLGLMTLITDVECPLGSIDPYFCRISIGRVSL